MSFRWLVVLLFPLALQSAPMETMAWHFPTRPNLDFFAEDLDPIKDPPETKPPGLSVFTPKDQPVKDFSESFRRHFKLGQDSWLVWNESRKLLVARSSPVVLWQIEDETDFAKQLRQIQVTFSWYQGIEPGKPVPPEAKPIHQSTIVTRSGQSASQAWAAGEATALSSTKINVTPTLGDEERAHFNMQLNLDWQEGVGETMIEWSYQTSMVCFEEGASKQICVQVDSRSGQSWTITMDGLTVLMDGFPKAKSKLYESDGKEVVSKRGANALTERGRTQLQTRAGPVPMVVFAVPPDFLSLISEATNAGKEVDPFAAQTSEPKSAQASLDKLIEIPDDLKASLPQRLIRIDIGEMGITIAPGGFVGYEPDPISPRVYAVGLAETEFAQLEQLISGGCLLIPKIIKISEHLTGVDQNGRKVDRRAVLLSRSGARAVLTSSLAQDQGVEQITIEPTIGDSDTIFDLHYESRFKLPLFESNSSLTLPLGVEINGATLKLEGGKTLTQSLKASIISEYEPD